MVEYKVLKCVQSVIWDTTTVFGSPNVCTDVNMQDASRELWQ